MATMLSKGASTIYDILEATIRAAIQFTEADAGHIFLLKHGEQKALVSHQCLVTDRGEIIRQYQDDRPFIYGPCQRSIDERKMYYVADAKSHSLHRLLLAELGQILERAEPGSLKQRYLTDYFDFLRKAKSYISVPIKRLNIEPLGALALYSYTSEDAFGAMKKRIIEEYMDNFASSLIVSLIDKASQDNQRMKELLESYDERFLLDMGLAPGNVFDARDHSEFQGVGQVVEHLLSRAGEKQSWQEILDDIERFLICYALKRASGRVQHAFRMLKMPKRTFYNKVNKLSIDVHAYTRQNRGP